MGSSGENAMGEWIERRGGRNVGAKTRFTSVVLALVQAHQ